jgi:tRNA uridine 5-carbamoylmethylation protein Kti12
LHQFFDIKEVEIEFGKIELLNLQQLRRALAFVKTFNDSNNSDENRKIKLIHCFLKGRKWIYGGGSFS